MFMLNGRGLFQGAISTFVWNETAGNIN